MTMTVEEGFVGTAVFLMENALPGDYEWVRRRPRRLIDVDELELHEAARCEAKAVLREAGLTGIELLDLDE